jgi:hypothetical protein
MVYSIHGIFKIDSVCILYSARSRDSMGQFQNENWYVLNHLFKPIIKKCQKHSIAHFYLFIPKYTTNTCSHVNSKEIPNLFEKGSCQESQGTSWPGLFASNVDARSLVSSKSSRTSVVHPSPSSDPSSRRSPPGPYRLSSPWDPCCLASLAPDIPVSCSDCSAPTDPCRSSQDPDLIGLFPSSLDPSHPDSS